MNDEWYGDGVQWAGISDSIALLSFSAFPPEAGKLCGLCGEQPFPVAVSRARFRLPVLVE